MVGNLLLMKINLKQRRSRKTHGKDDKGRSLIKKERYDLEENLCRICLKSGDIPIFEDDMSTLHEDINSVANIEVSSVDKFPKFICIQCMSVLQSAILFRKTAQISDKKLRNSKQNISSDQIEALATHTAIIKKDGSSSSKCSDELAVHQADSEDGLCKVEICGSENKTHCCDICSLTYASLKELMSHKKIAGHKKIKQECPICNKTYPMTYFKTHMTYHSTVTPFHVCDICGKGFRKKTQFARHRATHGNALPFQCEVCPYRGRFRESLKLHMRTHTGEKPYKCPECPVQCLTKSNLNRHMRIHKKERDFHCDVCNKGFFTHRELSLHIKVDHSGVKDHVCNICNKAFGYRKQMMKHQLKVHKREKMMNGRLPLYMQVEKKNLLEDIGQGTNG